MSGDGLRDLAIIAEERRRWLQPGLFSGMNVVAETLATSTEAGTETVAAVLDQLIGGEIRAAWAAGAEAWWPQGPVSPSNTPAPATGYRLPATGSPERPARCSTPRMRTGFLVSARTTTPNAQFLVGARDDGVRVREERAHDITQRFGSVAPERVEIPHAAALIGGEDADGLPGATA